MLDTPRRPLSLLPSFAPSASSSKAPRIRTPTAHPSPPYYTTNFKAMPSSSRARMRFVSPLPKAVTRGLLVLLGLVGVVMLSRAGGSQRDWGQEGRWDASTVSDRRPAGFDSVRRKFWGGYAPDPSGIRAKVGVPRRPNLSRQNASTTRPSHPGRSRRVMPSRSRVGEQNGPVSEEEYEHFPLPTLEEAFEFLHPLLRKVKDEHPSIPREHELTNPIFSPFITDDLKERYRHLRDDWDAKTGQWVRGEERRWFLVTVCRQVAGMLADWFAAWTVLADFLGPESLVFSLLEGDSADGSGEILSQVMRTHLLNIGVPPENIHIRTHLPAIDWESVHRIEQLAAMRNEGMQPFYASIPSDGSPATSPDGHPWTAVVYYNDVYLSAQHFLELMHQHFKQDADMTCGWDHAGKWFYDGWVGRDMSGDLYTPFPVKEEDKDLPQKLFPSHPATLRRYERMLPFQVFAGWNGITVMSPEPFMPPYNVRFRRGRPRDQPSVPSPAGFTNEEKQEPAAGGEEEEFIELEVEEGELPNFLGVISDPVEGLGSDGYQYQQQQQLTPDDPEPQGLVAKKRKRKRMLKRALEERRAEEDEEWECQASESSFISWDFWKYGFGRVAVVPGVHATYGKEDAMVRGWLEWPNEGDGMSELIQWDDRPPGKVRCHDWPDKPGKGWWAWDTVRWVSPPKLEIPE